MFEIFLATIVVSLISLIGFFFLSNSKTIQYLVSFAAGTLLATAFLELLPEAISYSNGEVLIFSLFGFIGFFLFESFLSWHHHEKRKPSAPLLLLGDALHNFLDGIAIAASFMTSFHLGLATTLSIALHEIPQELGDFSLLLKSGFSKRKALLANLFSGITALLGAFLYLNFSSFIEESYLLALTAGMFIYIATVDIIPEVLENKKIQNIFLVLLGILVIYLL